MIDGAPRTIESPVWIERVDTVASVATGIFYPLVKRGTYVEKGALVGYVTDYLGRTILDARAPDTGVVLFIRAVPSMTKGETIVNIGVPQR
jgi:predicted deacylase